MQTDDSLEDESRQHDACHNIPEKIPCPVCEGVGIITFEEDEWELKIVADEDAETG